MESLILGGTGRLMYGRTEFDVPTSWLLLQFLAATTGSTVVVCCSALWAGVSSKG